MTTRKRDRQLDYLLNAGKIVRIISYRERKNGKGGRAEIILFDDGKTIMELDDQDPFVFHDRDNSAKTIRVFQDENTWKHRMNDECFTDALWLV